MNKNKILDQYLDLFNKRTFAQLATIMPDGSPQVSPVWVDYDGEEILINTAVGRQKYLNMRRDARVAVAIQDPDNPYRKLLVRGRVIEMTEKGADEHIDMLARKYTGAEKYQNRRPGEVRVIVKIKARHVSS